MCICVPLPHFSDFLQSRSLSILLLYTLTHIYGAVGLTGRAQLKSAAVRGARIYFPRAVLFAIRRFIFAARGCARARERECVSSGIFTVMRIVWEKLEESRERGVGIHTCTAAAAVCVCVYIPRYASCMTQRQLVIFERISGT